jgi:hypothetical protein
MPRAKISPWKAAAPAALVVVAAAACGSTSGASATPSASPASSGSATQTSVLCRDIAAFRTTATQKASSTTTSTVNAEVQALTGDLTNVAHAGNGRFAPQADALKSSLETLKSQIIGMSHGTTTTSSVTTAAKNVQTRAVDLATAVSSECPSE